MERNNTAEQLAVELAISDMMWEGGPAYVEPADKPEPKSVVGLNNSQFPERDGNRLRERVISEIVKPAAR